MNESITVPGDVTPEAHPVADLFPLLSEEELGSLAEDIHANGLREPIWLHEGLIVDGRNRYAACQLAGVEPSFRVWDGAGSLVSFVVSLNWHRRHLSSSQRAMVSVDALPMLEAEAKERISLATSRRHERIRHLEELLKTPELSVAKQLYALADLERAKGQPKRDGRREQTDVYFIAAGERVKIGASIDPEERLKGIRTSNPEAQLLVAVPGGFELEKELHRKFAHLRVDGEWFLFAQELADEIEDLSSLSNSCKAREAFHSAVQAADVFKTNRQYVSDAKKLTVEHPELAEQVRNGELTIPEAKKSVRQQEKAERVAQIAAVEPSPLAGTGPFDVLYVDPPWRYEHAEPTRQVENHYPTMSLDEIKSLEPPATDSCVLFMWATSPKLAESMQVLDAWGFDYRTCMVWVKDKIGMGYYARQQHELLLIAKRGDSRAPDPEDRPPSVVHAPRLQHSAKPDAFYDLIERMYPFGSYGEMFARRPRDRWGSWGNQA